MIRLEKWLAASSSGDPVEVPEGKEVEEFIKYLPRLPLHSFEPELK